MKRLASYLTHTLRNWNVPILAIVVALGMAMCCSNALAQSGAGSIQGTVTDPTGAVIPGATVHAVQQGTNATFNTKTNAVGFYQVPQLFTGTYVVTYGAPGFKMERTTVELQVAQAAIINPALTAGAVTSTVEVAADVVQLTTTDNGTIASTLEYARINQLPMNGRALTTLAGMTVPGLEGGTRANGLMSEALEYVADGVPLTNRQFGGQNDAGALIPDVDTVQEVRIETTNTGAQFSEPATAIITTKSGTNSLHGALFETARNNAIGIAKNRSNPAIFKAPHLVRNEYGASVGGPIIIPHVYHGKDKSFWFFAYEKYSNASASSELVTVPTTAMRGGDFSGLTNSSSVLQVLYDPATTQSAANNYARTAFPGNKIPIGRLAPTSKIIYDITVAPGTADNPLVAPNLSAVNPNNLFVPTWTFRFDHAFNENNRVYLRYTSNLQVQTTLRNYPANSPATIAADGFPTNASGIAYNPAATFATGIGYTHVFSPTFFAETILSQQWYGQHNYAGGTPSADFEKMLGVPNNFGEGGFPNFGANLICPYGGTQFVYGQAQIVTNLDENLTKTVGRQQMQFGGRYRHERFSYLPDELADYVSFSNQATGIYNPTTGANYGVTANTGYADADMFLGAASSYEVTLEPPVEHFHDMEFDAYFQDNVHVSRNLTANFGLRYEAHPAPWMKYGLMQGFDLKNDAMVLAVPPATLISEGYTTQAIITNMQNFGVKFETPAEAGMPDALLNNYNLTFSPRLGIAYQPFGGKHGTVIRGAYGRYIYPVPTRSAIKQATSNAPAVATYYQSYTSASQSPDGLGSYLLRNPQTVVMGTNSANVVNTTTTTAILPGIAPYTMDPLIPPDFVTQTNLTVEQPLKGNSVLRLSWLWAHGTNLDQEYFPNSHPSTYVWEMQKGIIPPTGGASTIGTNQYASTATGPYDQTTWGNNIWDQKSGWSNDNALQVNYQRLYHRGIAYQVYYVWSRPFRVGGNYWRDALIYPKADYATSGVGTMTSPYGTVIAPSLPPAAPSGIASYAYYKALNRYQNYHLDSAIPQKHIIFNGVADLPFGRGKRFLGNSNRLLDEVVGGFQLAGSGSIVSQDYQPASGNWGPTNPLKTYKHGAPITDCRSGVCHPSFEWFNGYIAPTANASSGQCTAANGVASSNGVLKCVYGLPANYTPYQVPIDNTPLTTNYGANNVQVALLNGTTPTVGYSPGPQGANPFSQTFLNGPINYTINLSVFKVFPITEEVRLRFNVDAFNALNMQGYNNPNTTDGTEAYQPNGASSSYNTPRQVQFTLRLQF